jgi:hypothetical protein
MKLKTVFNQLDKLVTWLELGAKELKAEIARTKTALAGIDKGAATIDETAHLAAVTAAMGFRSDLETIHEVAEQAYLSADSTVEKIHRMYPPMKKRLDAMHARAKARKSPVKARRKKKSTK